MLQRHAFAGQIPALQRSFIDSTTGSRNSLTESLRIEIADLKKNIYYSITFDGKDAIVYIYIA